MPRPRTAKSLLRIGILLRSENARLTKKGTRYEEALRLRSNLGTRSDGVTTPSKRIGRKPSQN